MKLSEIAKILNENHRGNDVDIKKPGNFETGFKDQILYIEDKKYLDKALSSNPAALIVPYETDPGNIPHIKVKNPKIAYIKILELFNPFTKPSGMDKHAVIDGNASIGKDTAVMAGAVIMSGAKIGDDCAIYPNCVIEKNVVIGDNTTLYPGVVVRECCSIGNGCIIHPGAVIGADGYGFELVDDEMIKIPHIGTVEIGNNVEIGANCTIDRAKVDKTVIGDHTKLDNLVHIAHNVKIGKMCRIIAQAGISGSVSIGDRVIISGQAGLVDNISIADDTIIMVQSGIHNDIKKPDVVFGTPARPVREHHKISAALKYLPDLLKRVRFLEEKLQKFEKSEKK